MIDGGVPADLLERAATLRQAGQPFVLATVVRSLKPASARPGDRALILADNRTVGWVGGGCVHTTIEREALKALAEQTPRLVRLSPEPLDEPGLVSYPMSCHSGGTLEIFLEPVVPRPELVVVGESPAAATLRVFGPHLGFRLESDLAEVSNPSEASFVAAGMSSADDDPAVRATLDKGIPYVGLVASRRRAEALIADLRSDGVSEASLARLSAPAGLHLGAANGAEIALSILADIVQRRRLGQRIPKLAAEPQRAMDPVCGMQVDPAAARWKADRDGTTYYFCAPGCRKAFLAAAV